MVPFTPEESKSSTKRDTRFRGAGALVAQAQQHILALATRAEAEQEKRERWPRARRL